MPGFSILSITIQGFKGFSIEKSIQLDGKHLFILGPNGMGKSSIIEAIRWCLFGQLWRPNEIVSNRLIPSDCIVNLRLNRDGSDWNLRRKLSLGSTGGSDAVLKDSNGKVHKITDVLPQLDSVESGESMHIICTSQDPRHRISSDLKAFERTILAYLGLSEIKSLKNKFKEYIKKYEDNRDEIAKNISETEETINEKISEIIEQRSKLLSGLKEDILDESSIRNRIIQQLTALGKQAINNDDKSINDLLENLENSVEEEESTSLDEKRDQVEQLKNEIEDFRESIHKIEDLNDDRIRYIATIETIQSEIDQLLDGSSFEKLNQKKDEQDRIRKKKSSLFEILQLTADYINGNPHDRKINCPICEQRVGSKKGLLQRIQNRINSSTHEDMKQSHYRQSLMKNIDEVNDLKVQLNNKNEIIEQTELKMKDLIGLNDIDSIDEEKIRLKLQELEKTKSEKQLVLKEQENLLENHEGKIKEHKDALNVYKINMEIHKLNRELLDYEEKTKILWEGKSRFRLLNEFIDNVIFIKCTLHDVFEERLKSELPELNAKLTDAFKSLTGHGSFDSLIIHIDVQSDLKLKVKSNAKPELEFDTEQVLNGQALSATQLVPYFAFSDMTGLAIEIHTILLDDPTQSFDKSHIKILLENLAQLGNKAQLIIGSHEINTFKEYIPIYFNEENYKIIEIAQHNLKEGPIWETQND